MEGLTGMTRLEAMAGASADTTLIQSSDSFELT